MLNAPPDAGPAGPVPPDNEPGHHPDHEQDKPDPNAFAAKLGLAAPQRDAGPPPDGPSPPASPAAPARAPRPFPVVPVVGLAALGLVAALMVRRSRRRR